MTADDILFDVSDGFIASDFKEDTGGAGGVMKSVYHFFRRITTVSSNYFRSQTEIQILILLLTY